MRKVMLLVLMTTFTAHAALAKGKKPEVKPPTPVVEPAKPADKDALTLKRLVETLRKATKESDDVPAQLLGGLAEASLSGVIQGHYALAGCGQAMRTGGLSADNTRAYARDMADNWQQLTQVYGKLAGQKAFDPELRNIFQSLALMAEKAAQTALLLAAWAELPQDNGRAVAFEAALEDHRGRVKAFVAFVQGPGGK